MRFTETMRTTPNIGRGINECKGVILHHTAGAFDGSVAWLTNRESGASAHVVIAKDGRRASLAPDSAVTWHAGKSEWKGRASCNLWTLGVEFELTEADVKASIPLTQAQIESCLEWLEPRMQKYGWTVDDITDHRTVARPRGRKADLSPANFDIAMSAIRARFAPATEAPRASGDVRLEVPRDAKRIIIDIKE